MARTRGVVSLGLEQRAAAGINVRQPLAKATVSGPALAPELLALVKDELNVLEAVSAGGETLAVALDTTLTPELKTAGALRELVRHVQALRKKAGLRVGDSITLAYEATGGLAKTFEEVADDLAKAVRATAVSRGRADLPHAEEVDMQGEKVWIGIEKT